MKLSSDTLKHIASVLAHTRSEEIGCNECFEQLDRFVDMILAGSSVEEAMPLVRDHLACCRDCKEEFELLLEALRDAH